MAICLSCINFTANDRFYPCLPSRQVKINNTIHCTMVSNSKAVHTQLFGLGDKLWDTAHAVEQAILCMNVEVGKLLRHFLNYSTRHCEQSEAITTLPSLLRHFMSRYGQEVRS